MSEMSYQEPNKAGESIESRLLKSVEALDRRVTLVLCGIFIILCIFGGFSLYFNDQNTKRLAENKAVAQQIQKQRRDVAFKSCVDQNTRNNVAQSYGTDLKASPEGHEAIRGLIDSIIPKQDCAKLVKERVPNAEGN